MITYGEQKQTAMKNKYCIHKLNLPTWTLYVGHLLYIVPLYSSANQQLNIIHICSYAKVVIFFKMIQFLPSLVRIYGL